MLIHQISLPQSLQLFNKKPWEITHLDILHLWRFGDYKHYTSLKLMAHVLGIPSPKDDIDGSQVASVFYEEKNLERIITYCEKDVVTVAQVFLKLRSESLLKTEEIIFSQ
jgi:predicted PolB exonuclease-like 3'-5' exonuclease